MSKTALELTPPELQGTVLDEPAIARAVALANPTNQRIREAADVLLRFEDEPVVYVRFLREEAR